MRAVDTNVLVYAHRREAREHPVAVDLVAGLARGSEPWAIPWPCIYEFFSVVTNRRIWKLAASSPVEASAQIDAWCASPSLRLLGESPDFWSLLRDFTCRPRVSGAVVQDARVAALCLAHGARALITRDRDFALFPELALEDPFRK